MDTRDASSKEPGASEQIRGIRSNAELVIRTFSRETEFEFGYNEDSVKWLDAYIEIIRQSNWTQEELNQLVSNFGSFLGETIVRNFGGEWWLDERGWAVRWDESELVYPFNRVAKHLKAGSIDSILSFYAVTGAVHKF